MTNFIAKIRKQRASLGGITLLYYFSAFLFVLAFIFVFLFYFIKLGPASYPLGDMLINYSCGIIRRGLLGTVMLNVSNLLNADVFILFSYTCLGAFLIVFGFIIKKLLRFPVVLFLFAASPFGILFIVNDWRSFGYKDIFIVLLLLAVLKLTVTKSLKRYWPIVALLILTASLIHELFIFVSCPFILLHLNMNQRTLFPEINIRKLNVRTNYSFLFLFFVAALLSLIYLITINDNILKAECLRDQYKLILSKRIVEPFQNDTYIYWPLDWIGKGVNDAITLTSNNYLNPMYNWKALPQLLLLIVVIVSILVYLFGLKRIIANLKTNYILAAYILASVFFTFIIGSDWGRWMFLIFMHVIVFISVNSHHIDIKRRQIPKNKIVALLFFSLIILISFIRVPSFYMNNDSIFDTAIVRVIKSVLN